MHCSAPSAQPNNDGEITEAFYNAKREEELCDDFPSPSLSLAMSRVFGLASSWPVKEVCVENVCAFIVFLFVFCGVGDGYGKNVPRGDAFSFICFSSY